MKVEAVFPKMFCKNRLQRTVGRGWQAAFHKHAVYILNVVLIARVQILIDRNERTGWRRRHTVILSRLTRSELAICYELRDRGQGSLERRLRERTDSRASAIRKSQSSFARPLDSTVLFEDVQHRAK